MIRTKQWNDHHPNTTTKNNDKNNANTNNTNCNDDHYYDDYDDTDDTVIKTTTTTCTNNSNSNMNMMMKDTDGGGDGVASSSSSSSSSSTKQTTQMVVCCNGCWDDDDMMKQQQKQKKKTVLYISSIIIMIFFLFGILFVVSSILFLYQEQEQQPMWFLSLSSSLSVTTKDIKTTKITTTTRSERDRIQYNILHNKNIPNNNINHTKHNHTNRLQKKQHHYNYNQHNQKQQQKQHIRTDHEDTFWSFFDGKIHVPYKPKGHPYDIQYQSSRKQQQQQQQQKQQHRQNQEENNNNNENDDIDDDDDDDVEYRPIRIRFVTDPFDSLLFNDTSSSISSSLNISYIQEQIRYITHTILLQAATTWSKHLRVVPVDGYLSILSSQTCQGKYNNKIRSTKNQTTTSTSSSSTSSSSSTTTKQQSNSENENENENDDEYAIDESRYYDADLIIIVSGTFIPPTTSTSNSFSSSSNTTTTVNSLYDPTCLSALAYASVCAIDQYGRPVIGYMNFCLRTEPPINSDSVTTSTTTTTTTAIEDSTNTNTSNSSRNTTTTNNNNSTDDSNNNNNNNLLQSVIHETFGPWTNKVLRSNHSQISILAVSIHEMGHVLGVISPLFIYFRDRTTGQYYTNMNNTVNTNNNMNNDSTGVSSGSGSMSTGSSSSSSSVDQFPVIEKRCANGTLSIGIYPSDEVVRTVLDPITGYYKQYLVTPRVKQVSQNHYNCTSIIGGRLEDHRECIGTHWHERDLYSELLSPLVSMIGENVLSPFTLALLDDSGWYEIDYQYAPIPKFGINAGCQFVNDLCINTTTSPTTTTITTNIDYDDDDGVDAIDLMNLSTIPTWATRSEFCTTPFEVQVADRIVSEASLNHILCDVSHLSWAVCDLFVFHRDITTMTNYENNDNTTMNNDSYDVNMNGGLQDMRYFTDTRLRPEITLADGCPIPSIPLGLDCTKSDSYNIFYPGESVGPNSRCYNAYYTNEVYGQIYQPACLRTYCDTIQRTTYIVFMHNNNKIGEEGEEEEDTLNMDPVLLPCEYTGQILPIPFTENGYIECPRLEILCPEFYTCPNYCSGRGQCLYNHSSTTSSTQQPPVPYCQCDDVTNTDPACTIPTVLKSRANVLDIFTNGTTNVNDDLFTNLTTPTTMNQNDTTTTTEPSTNDNNNSTSNTTTTTENSNSTTTTTNPNPSSENITNNGTTSTNPTTNNTGSISSTPIASSGGCAILVVRNHYKVVVVVVVLVVVEILLGWW